MTARARKPTATVRAPSAPTPAAVDPTVAEGFIQEGRARAAAGRPETSPDVPRARPRAPQGSKVLLARKSGDVRRRMTVYLQEDTADRLKAWCEAGRTHVSGTIDDAINAWLDQQVRVDKPF